MPYFSVGWPKRFELPSEEAIQDIEHSPDHSLLAVITLSSLFIWTGEQHTALLGHFSRTALTEGVNEKLIWHPDSLRITVKVRSLPRTHPLIFVQTSEGFLHLYKIDRNVGPPLEIPLAKGAEKLLTYLPLRVQEQINITLLQSVTGPGRINCLVGDAEHIYAGTASGSIVKYKWLRMKLVSEVPLQEMLPVPDAKLQTAANGAADHDANQWANSEITHLSLSASAGLMGVVLANGMAALVQLGDPKTKVKPTGQWVGVTNAMCTAINTKHRILAVGLNDGDTALFDNGDLQRPALRHLSLKSWGFGKDDTGAVRCVAWTPDSAALAVGWVKRGLSLWSQYGCRLMCTIPQSEGIITRSISSVDVAPNRERRGTTDNRQQATKGENFRHGVTAMSWGTWGYRLLVVSKVVRAEITQFSFFKSCLAANPSLNYSEQVLLQGEDRLLFLSKTGNQGHADVNWRHLQIPQDYLDDNWPVQRVAVTHDRDYIAVAGKRGVAVYSGSEKRWKLFGDRHQEQEIVCHGLCWYKQLVVIVCHNQTTKRYELRFYPQSHLANSSLVLRHEIPHNRKPVFVDCNDEFLLLLTTGSLLMQYHVKAKEDGKEIKSLELTLASEVSIAALGTEIIAFLLLPQSIKNVVSPSSPPTSPSSSPPSSGAGLLAQQPAKPSCACLILSSTGLLSLINTDRPGSVPLASNVEQFWFGGDSLTLELSRGRVSGPRAANLHGSTIWTYGQAGMQVWFPLDGASPQKMQRKDRSLEFDTEVYPVGFVPELGLIVGVTQGVSYHVLADAPCFELRTKTHPFVHSILRHHLNLDSGSDFSEALAVARRYSGVPLFGHALELLLHEILEEHENEQEDRRKSRPQLPEATSGTVPLERAVEFLRRFPQFPDVVVQCARKRDKAVWGTLFAATGTPKPLFEQALAGRRLNTAASYLIIMHQLEGPIVSRKGAHKLLELVLENDDLEMASDLMRFLEPASELLYLDAPSNQPVKEFDFSIDDEEFYLQEMILARYAKRLLQQKNLQKLLYFSRIVRRELHVWLVRERRRAAVVEDLSEALALLHAQFLMPYRDSLPTSRNNSHSSNLNLMEATGAPTTTTVPLSSLAVISDESAEAAQRADLAALLQAMSVAQCAEWTLLLATILFRIPTIIATLTENPYLWKPFQKTLSCQTCGAYRELLRLLVHQFGEASEPPSPSSGSRTGSARSATGSSDR